MKTIFAIIGFVVCCMWVNSFLGDKIIMSGVKTAWNFSSRYINNAINSAQDKAKRTTKHY